MKKDVNNKIWVEPAKRARERSNRPYDTGAFFILAI